MGLGSGKKVRLMINMKVIMPIIREMEKESIDGAMGICTMGLLRMTSEMDSEKWSGILDKFTKDNGRMDYKMGSESSLS